MRSIIIFEIWPLGKCQIHLLDRKFLEFVIEVSYFVLEFINLIICFFKLVLHFIHFKFVGLFVFFKFAVQTIDGFLIVMLLRIEI